MQITKGITPAVNINTLNNLKQGQKARVLRINGGDQVTKQRLLDMWNWKMDWCWFHLDSIKILESCFYSTPIG